MKCPKCNSSKIVKKNKEIYCKKCGYEHSETKKPIIINQIESFKNKQNE